MIKVNGLIVDLRGQAVWADTQAVKVGAWQPLGNFSHRHNNIYAQVQADRQQEHDQ